MTPKALKSIVAKIRQACASSPPSGGFLTLREVADLCSAEGMPNLNLKFWRSVAANGNFPAVLFAGRWHVRRDYVEELHRQLHLEAA